jgi:hypothetical protein
MQTLFPINWAQAELHARILGGNTGVTIQTFADSPEDRADVTQRKRLARVLHGDLSDSHFRAKLQRLHNDGAGLFITVNRTDGLGRRTDNIVAVIAATIDADLRKPGVAETCNAFIHRSGLTHSLIIESSDGNFHYYILLTDCTLAEYEAVQRMLHTRAGTDALHDLARVLRLAGAWHRKGEPFQSRIIEVNDVTYTVAELRRRAEQVAPVTSHGGTTRVRKTTTANTKRRTGPYDATTRLHVLFERYNGLVVPATRELIRQVGAEGCGRHDAVVAVCGRLVFQTWSDERAIEFLVPLVNDAFGEGDWTDEVLDALRHARRRAQERVGSVRTAIWR